MNEWMHGFEPQINIVFKRRRQKQQQQPLKN